MAERRDNRKLWFTIAAGVWAVALTFVVAKGWAERLPDGLVLALCLVPVIIVIVLVVTHHKVRKFVYTRWLMSFLTFVAVGTIAGGAVSAFIWWALFTTKSTARADVAVVVYEPFRVIRASHPKLGAALREAESVENRDTNTWWLYLGKHQHAFVVWDRAFYQLGTDGQNNNRWFRVVDLMDQGVNQELAATYGDPRRLREHFRNVPNGLEPPYGGVGQGWDYSPDTWRWIGWRVWHFNVCGVMKQEFEGGRIYAPVPIHRGANQNAEAVVLLYDANSRDRGSWEYQDIRGMVAPRTRDPFESKPCWEN